MTGRRLALVVGAGAAVIALCAGCGDTAAPSATTPSTAGVSDSSGDQLGSQLDQLQSTLDSVQAQISADSTP